MYFDKVNFDEVSVDRIHFNEFTFDKALIVLWR